MRVSKFTSKESLLNYIKDNLHLKNVEVSKLFIGDKVEDDTYVVFQLRTSGRITLYDLGNIGLLHKDVGITYDKGMLLLTWSEQ